MSPDQTITAILPSERSPGRMVIKVNGRTIASLPLQAVMDLGLGVGSPWNEQIAAQVQEAASFAKALAAARRLVNRSALSRRRVLEKMKRLGWDEPMLQRVVEHLEKIGAIDDEALGRALIEEIQTRKPAGPALLRAKLRQRGLENRLIEQLLEEAAQNPQADPVADAAELVRKRLRSLARLDPQVRKRRLWSMLARRGFQSDIIERALAQVAELKSNSDD